MKTLSFIVPVYNVAPYLRKCVDSLLAQDYEDSEIILVDDGSPDASPQICDEYAATHKNIRVLHQPNGGLSAARNSGIKAAKGEYICFVDSDDYWEPNVLNRLMAQIDQDNLDVLRFRLQYVNPQYQVFNPYKSDPFIGNDYSEDPTDGVTFLNTRMNTACYVCAFIVKRDLVFNSSTHSFLNSFTEGIYFEDTDWTPRMLACAKKVASTSTVVYNYLQRDGSITKAVNRSQQRKVLDDKMRLIVTLQNQAIDLQKSGRYTIWYNRMISDTVVSVIGMLSTTFYAEKDGYLEQLQDLKVFPIAKKSFKARLMNISPRLTVELLHFKNSSE